MTFKEKDVVSAVKNAPLDTGDHGFFGFSVAADGDTLVVGAPYMAVNETEQVGAVYVFQKQGGAWSINNVKALLPTESPTDMEKGGRFGYSVAIKNSIIVVGAYRTKSGEGAAYVFEKSGDSWSKPIKLLSSHPSDGMEFGNVVATDGHTIVIGAHAANAGKGSAYVFEKTGSWQLTKELSAYSDEYKWNFFSESVAVNGDWLVATAPNFGNGDQTDGVDGKVYVFKRENNEWNEIPIQQIINPDKGNVDYFGRSVAISGNRMIIGANGAEQKSAAYIFEYDSQLDRWLQNSRLLGSDYLNGNAYDFGNWVDIDGDISIVGAPQSDQNGSKDLTGAAYIFSLTPNLNEIIRRVYSWVSKTN